MGRKVRRAAPRRATGGSGGTIRTRRSRPAAAEKVGRRPARTWHEPAPRATGPSPRSGFHAGPAESEPTRPDHGIASTTRRMERRPGRHAGDPPPTTVPGAIAEATRNRDRPSCSRTGKGRKASPRPPRAGLPLPYAACRSVAEVWSTAVGKRNAEKAYAWNLPGRNASFRNTSAKFVFSSLTRKEALHMPDRLTSTRSSRNQNALYRQARRCAMSITEGTCRSSVSLLVSVFSRDKDADLMPLHYA